MQKKWMAVGLIAAVSTSAWAATPVPAVDDKPATDRLISDIGGRDPLEGFNRSMFEVNNLFMRWVYRPVGTGYGTIMPRQGAKMVNNFADNVGFPSRMFSSFAQAKWEGGGIEFLRFLANSTVGVGGLFDPATPWFGLNRQDEDFGQAFASWGIGPGCSLTVPGVSGSNIRDGVGNIFDYAFDPKTYFQGAQAITMLHAGLEPYPLYEKLRWASRDSYYTARQLKLIQRQMQLTDWKLDDAMARVKSPCAAQHPSPLPTEKVIPLDNAVWQCPVIDTLRVQWFRPRDADKSMWVNVSPWNSDFDNEYSLREVKIKLDDKREPMVYRYWPAPEKNPDAPLAVLLPGLGGHAMGGMTVPLAEMFHNRGWSVIVLSSAFNWEFATRALPGSMPGFTPADAQAIRQAIFRIVEDLEQTDKLNPSSMALAGYSQGALHTLFIAQQEAKNPHLKFDRYIAINPPVDMYYGLTQLDGFYHTGDQWSSDEARERVINAAGVYLAASQMPVEDASVLPINEEDARFLIGYSYRLTLTELLAALHQQSPLAGVKTPYKWSDQNSLYEEIGAYDYHWYVENCLLPYYRGISGQTLTLDELNAQSGLRAIQSDLKSNAKVRVLVNYDDFLLRDNDRQFLEETFGDRMKVFANGGHLGNLYHPKVQEVIQSAIP